MCPFCSPPQILSYQPHYITYPAYFPACEHSGNAGIPHCRCDFLAFSACGRFLRRCLASLTVHDLIFPSYPGLAGRSARSDGPFPPQALPPGGMASVPQPLRFRAEPACSPAARYTTGLFFSQGIGVHGFRRELRCPGHSCVCFRGTGERGQKTFHPFLFPERYAMMINRITRKGRVRHARRAAPPAQ